MKRLLFGLMLAMTSVHCATCIDNSVHPEAIKHHDVGIEYLNNGQCVQAEERCRLALEYGPVPTTEVLLLELWDRLEPWIERPARLCRLRIYETSKNTFEYFGPPRSRMAHG